MSRLIVGLTGGIASGKSLAAEILEDLGCEIVDTDVISRQITSGNGTAVELLANAFPDAVENGIINRAKLRQIVFSDETKRIKLNEITHPLIEKETLRQIEKSQKDIVIVVVPLLFETAFHKIMNRNITVSCNEDMRIQRLIKRDNIGIELAKKIVGSQMSDEQREEMADFVLFNEGNRASFSAKIEELHKKLILEAKKYQEKDD